MFEASRILSQNKKKNTITVHNDNKEIIASDTEKANILKTWFYEQFTDSSIEALPPFIGPPRPLDCPITSLEVEEATKKLKTNRATGPDNIPNELLKHAGAIFHNMYATTINRSFETNTHISSVVEGIITPLQKPGKAKGPIKNLRPLTLLNGARKILSLITLKRVEHQIDNYTGAWQCAYKQGRSCADLLF